MDWIEKKVIRHLMQSCGSSNGLGCKRYSRSKLYQKMGLYDDYQIRYYRPLTADEIYAMI